MKRSQFKRKPEHKRLARTKAPWGSKRKVRNRAFNAARSSNTRYCDSLFSQAVRVWAGGVCARCHKTLDLELLECSHFFGRSRFATRYDPRNADALCHDCHQKPKSGWEFNKGEGKEYYQHMVRKLGADGFEALRQLSLTTVKPSDAREQFLARLQGGTLWAR